MSFEAKGNTVILKLPPANAEKTLDSGLVLPLQPPPDQGLVVSVGEGKYAKNGTLIPTGIKEGDTVLFSKLGAHGVFIEDVEYVYLDADNVLAIVGD